MGEIRKAAALKKREWLAYVGILLAIMGVGMLMEIIVFHFMEEEEIFPLGSTLAFILTGMMLFFMSSFGMALEFNSAVRFQRTRRQFFFTFLMDKAVVFLLIVLTVNLFWRVENTFLSVLFSEKEMSENADIIIRIPLWCYLSGMLLYLGVSALLGGIVMKAGTVGMTVWCVVWVGLCLGPTYLSDSGFQPQSGTVIGDLCLGWVGLGLPLQMVLLGVSGLLGILGAWLLIRKQRVTD